MVEVWCVVYCCRCLCVVDGRGVVVGIVEVCVLSVQGGVVSRVVGECGGLSRSEVGEQLDTVRVIEAGERPHGLNITGAQIQRVAR